MKKPNPVNEAAENWADQRLMKHVGEELDRYDLEAAFVAGANWQADRERRVREANDEAYFRGVADASET